MKKRVQFILVGVIFISFLGNQAYADSGGTGIAVKASTLGAGVELTKQIFPSINVRLGVNGYDYEYNGKKREIDYDIDLKLFSAAGLIDWYPFSGDFRLTAGALWNGNKIDLQAKPMTSYIIGDTTYTPSQVGSLKGSIEFNSVAPYAGIGWGNAASKSRKWGITFDLGVVYQGSPDITLTADGTLASNAAFLAELENEKLRLEDSLDEYEYYPVVSLGIYYRF